MGQTPRQTFHEKDSIAKPAPSGNLFVIILQTFQKKIASAHAPRMQPFCDHLACIPQKNDQRQLEVGWARLRCAMRRAKVGFGGEFGVRARH
jgi:hypothetical protein